MNDQAFSPVGYGLAGITDLRAIGEGKLYSYIFAGNGVFCHARRSGLEALVPVSRERILIHGLAEIQPFIYLAHSVPLSIFREILAIAAVAYPLEMLFYLTLETAGWRLVIPRQVQTTVSCVPVAPCDPDAARALVEVHSHGVHPPHFSKMDDRDEQGFRVYTVVGMLGASPSILTRVGVFGHFWEIPSRWIFDLPERLRDVMEDKKGGK